MKIALNLNHRSFKLTDNQILELASRKGVVLYPNFNDIQTVWWIVPQEQWIPLACWEDIMEMDSEGTTRYYSYLNDNTWDSYKLPRNDPDLLYVIEHSKEPCARIVEIPDDVKWYIDETTGGLEIITECHRMWDERGEHLIDSL